MSAPQKLFGGKHRRRHVRNETLTIVWNYTSTVMREWWAKANGRPAADGEAEEAQEHRNRFWRILYGTYNTNQEDATAMKQIESSTSSTEEPAANNRNGDMELQETTIAVATATTTNEETEGALALDP